MECNESDTLLNYSSIWSNDTRTRINCEMTQAIKNRKKSHTQKEVAEMFGVSRKKVVNFENGYFDFNMYDQYIKMFFVEV